MSSTITYVQLAGMYQSHCRSVVHVQLLSCFIIVIVFCQHVFCCLDSLLNLLLFQFIQALEEFSWILRVLFRLFLYHKPISYLDLSSEWSGNLAGSYASAVDIMFTESQSSIESSVNIKITKCSRQILYFDACKNDIQNLVLRIFHWSLSGTLSSSRPAVTRQESSPVTR